MTRYLCDTHVVLWAAADPTRLCDEVRSILEDPHQEVLVSSVSIAEMTIKRALGKLDLPTSPMQLCDALEFDPLPLTWAHADHLASLPPIHRDPFDRMLIAQAMVDDLTLITADPVIASYPNVVITSA